MYTDRSASTVAQSCEQETSSARPRPGSAATKTAAAALAAGLLAGPAALPASRPFGIRVVDPATGRGIPLAELQTVHDVRYVTDSAGWAAVMEPGLEGQSVFFHVRSHGYQFPADGFGFRGRAVTVRSGGKAVMELPRLNLAERLYRVTGGGIYRDSLLLGKRPPLRQPGLNAQVVGSDSVLTAVYRGRVYWFWGDTNRPGYPLGNFHVPGAVSELPGQGGLDPDRGVDLHYFTGPDGFAKETARLPGEGPTWLMGLTVLPDGPGAGRMFAAYMKVRNQLEVYRRGLVEWDDGRKEWRHAADFPLDGWARPDGHPFLREAGGKRYVYYANPYPLVRVEASPAALRDPAAYEGWSCLAGSPPEVQRGPGGAPLYAWRRGIPPLEPEVEARLVREGKLRPEEARLRLRDAETGKPVTAHRGTVNWNEFRRRWVMIATEIGGASQLGEVWYAEAETPEGPWDRARKIVTHDRYSFYNPRHHPMFDQDGGRRIYFEGTYTRSFSGNPEATPRYEYNQVMYRLDLADPRLRPAP